MNYKQLIKKISLILHDWDPIGLTPIDEYDDLSMRLFSQVKKNDSRNELIDFLNKYLRDQMGLQAVNQSRLESTADAVLSQYKEYLRSGDKSASEE